MAALDLLGRRWSLRVLWELLASPAGFRELQGRCGGMSASVLNTRLKELQQTMIVTLDGQRRWALTPLGRELIDALFVLHHWSEKWATQLASPAKSEARPNRRG
jgi:DNA-binding HxlR family transcriptional regulator